MTAPNGNGTNKVSAADRAVHDWYRFVLAFPPHLVRAYLEKFSLDQGATVLDPFCGTGTTLVEARLNRIASVGLDATPFLAFAAATKLDWHVNPDQLRSLGVSVADRTRRALRREGIDDSAPLEQLPPTLALRKLDPQTDRLLLKDSISPLPLHKTLVLLDSISRFRDAPGYYHALLALANSLVTKVGNLHFGPEVGIGKIKVDVPVVSLWLADLHRIASDLGTLQSQDYPGASVHSTDARTPSLVLVPTSVDAVITSPPYPNEKDYTRTTRLESVLLGFTQDREQLRSQKQGLLRSNTRNVYKNDNDMVFVQDFPEIQRLAAEIESRRLQLGKDSGFEKLYSKVTLLYFGGMARHLANMRPCLKPEARLAYVVGDQASYLRVMIRTGHLLATIADRLGYQVESIDLFRTRFATATREQLNEEVLVLRWPARR